MLNPDDDTHDVSKVVDTTNLSDMMRCRGALSWMDPVSEAQVLFGSWIQ